MDINFCPYDGSELEYVTSNLPVGSKIRDNQGTPFGGFFEGHIEAAFCSKCGYMTPFKLSNFEQAADFLRSEKH